MRKGMLPILFLAATAFADSSVSPPAGTNPPLAASASVQAPPSAPTQESVQDLKKKNEEERKVLSDELLSIRDPFRRVEVATTQGPPKSALEQYPADAFKLVGVLTGPARLKAMVVDPQGVTHFVSERMKIGLRGGFILKISPDAILVRERIVNLVGQEEKIDTDIRLQNSAGKSGVFPSVSTLSSPNDQR
jgi:Tfp pilus assembly protein PilP